MPFFTGLRQGVGEWGEGRVEIVAACGRVVGAGARQGPGRARSDPGGRGPGVAFSADPANSFLWAPDQVSAVTVTL